MLDINGKIPPHTECPYKTVCQDSYNNFCNHLGTAHNVPFSCAFARGFATVEHIRNRTIPLQLNLL